MLLPKRNFIGPLADFKLGSASTNVTESVKYLGVHIDNNLGQCMPRKLSKVFV